jgi:hypothetical protein
MVVRAANVHDLTPAAELLHGDERVVYADAGYQGIAKRPEMAGKTTEVRVAMQPGKRRALPDTPEGRLQDQCAGSLDESLPDPATVARGKLNMGMVCLSRLDPASKTSQ